MGWLAAVTAALGIFNQVEPLIEKLISGFLQFISDEAAKLSGDPANMVSSMMDQARKGVETLDAGAVDTVAWVESMAPTIKDLEAQWPGITKAIYNAHNIAADHKAPFGVGMAVNVSQHAAVRKGKA